MDCPLCGNHPSLCTCTTEDYKGMDMAISEHAIVVRVCIANDPTHVELIDESGQMVAKLMIIGNVNDSRSWTNIEVVGQDDATIKALAWDNGSPINVDRKRLHSMALEVVTKGFEYTSYPKTP